jgi:hypothetical protein
VLSIGHWRVGIFVSNIDDKILVTLLAVTVLSCGSGPLFSSPFRFEIADKAANSTNASVTG